MCLLSSDFYSERSGGAYEIELSAWGQGVLCESRLLDMQKPDEIIRKFKNKYRRYPKSISLLLEDPRAIGCDYCFTGIDTALLEKLETLKELILPDSVAAIDLTPKLEKILKDNDTLIRGQFGSFAERFAAELGLHFRPADCIIAEYETTAPPESVRLTLTFCRSGSVLIKEDCSSPGTSVSNTLGGSFMHSLKKDFYLTDSAEEIGARIGKRACEEIIKDGRLADFIEKAKVHGYYTGKN